MKDRAREELPVEREIRHEKARILGRAGEALEEACRRAWALRGATGRGEADAAAYRAARARASELRHLLILQREAIGLRSHAEVDRWYPLPPDDPSESSPPPGTSQGGRPPGR